MVAEADFLLEFDAALSTDRDSGFRHDTESPESARTRSISCDQQTPLDVDGIDCTTVCLRHESETFSLDSRLRAGVVFAETSSCVH
jgi:hypothetical protein